MVIPKHDSEVTLYSLSIPISCLKHKKTQSLNSKKDLPEFEHLLQISSEPYERFSPEFVLFAIVKSFKSDKN